MSPYRWGWDAEALGLVPALSIGYLVALRRFPASRPRIAAFFVGQLLILAVFQVFRRGPHDRDDEFETAHLVDLLEAEGWQLENVAGAAEDDHPQAFGVQTVRIVGTIYTFRLADGS